MEDSDQENHHRTKRRKLSTTHNADTPSQYIPLAQATLDVNIVSLERREGASADETSLPVTIKSCSFTEECYSIVVTAPWLKGNAIISTVHNGTSHQFLDDCSKLASFHKTRKDELDSPLALCNAHIHLAEPARLEVTILWHDSVIARDKVDPLLREILSRYSGSEESGDTSVFERWGVHEFYENVHVPPKTEAANADLKIDLLQCELYPFQRRALRWLLSREGIEINSSGELQALPESKPDSVMLRDTSQIQSQCENIGTYFVNRTLAVTCSSQEALQNRYKSIKGGLLGEAMGLGKTVEMIALICLHTMENSPIPTMIRDAHLTRSRATLIITPPSILDQWKQEIQEHAPSLKVFHYEGIKSHAKQKLPMINELCDQDIVLTTYNVLSKELHYVRGKSDRGLRNRPRFEPPKSPLNQIVWWRVCLDEAQMVESGVSAAAQVARLIPRVNAWAVTGTPLRQNHKDIYGLLLFLQYEPWCSSLRQWEYLLSFHRPLFRALMNEMAIRHSKEIVRDELRIPPQNRHTITISFTNIEQAHYSQMFHDMYQDCQLDRNGAPINDDWDPNAAKTIERMRTWLTRLRQTCLHPEVGGRNRKALGRAGGPLRTVAQVLDVMIDQTEGALRSEQRNMLMQGIRKGQVLENAKLKKDALEMYKIVFEESSTLVEECRKALQLEIQASKAKEPVVKDEGDDLDSEEDTEDSPVVSARQRYRSALEVLHICIFFMGNMYFQLKSDETITEPNSKDFQSLEESETQAYEQAKRIRGELLSDAVRKANRRTELVRSKDKSSRELVSIPSMELSLEYSGIESRKVFEKLYIFCEAMNVQAEQYRELRDKMVAFLKQALIDEDEGVELQGDEYETSTKHQDEMYAYMEALRALFADRSDAISGQENLLIRSEMKGFLRAAKDGEGPAPELMIKLLADRETKRIKIDEQGSLRGIVAEIRALSSALQWQEAGGSARAKAELQIVNDILQHTNQLVTAQSKAVTNLEQEVAYFRNSMNARLEYYKALQKISDTVAPYKEEDVGKPLDEQAFSKLVAEETNVRNKCSTIQAKQRYLLHLKQESVSESASRICTICQSEFEVGAITSCGHVFCKEDLQLWYATHGNCPVCKRRLRSADFFDVTYKPSEMTVQAETSASEVVGDSPNRSQSNTNSIYSDINTTQLNEIKNIDIRGASFGSKVDTICRHLHWLREHDSGSKVIIFSQFHEYLDVLGRAFRQNTISYSRCDQKDGTQTFRSNPAIQCFLLHAKAHSAGLNLVVASHVILCEPLVNTAIELQAIARVHRIGQHRATTVWMYLIADTVEQSIYDISVKRRLAHMSRDNSSRSRAHTPMVLEESAIDAANSKELQAADLAKALAPGRNGGELVDREDLWPCLFGNVSKTGSSSGRTEQLADEAPANGEVARFLRAEAAELRNGLRS